MYSHSGEHVLDMSTFSPGIFGATSEAVTLIAWTETPDGRRYWLQRRAKFMNVHPGKLDVTASGSLTAGEKPLDGMVRVDLCFAFGEGECKDLDI